MKKLIIFFIILAFYGVSAYAIPKQIVIIRHADKWSEEPGNTLNPRGYLRAVKFSEYYLEKFKIVPDFIFAPNPNTKKSSLRPIQTVAPLANNRECIAKEVYIDHEYTLGEERNLAKEILKNKKYNDKNILICWEHTRIVGILNNLGFKENITWNQDNYDSVYVLSFAHGKLNTTMRLDNQYPVPDIKDWEYFLKK
jgi:hypothetical protein